MKRFCAELVFLTSFPRLQISSHAFTQSLALSVFFEHDNLCVGFSPSKSNIIFLICASFYRLIVFFWLTNGLMPKPIWSIWNQLPPPFPESSGSDLETSKPCLEGRLRGSLFGGDRGSRGNHDGRDFWHYLFRQCQHLHSQGFLGCGRAWIPVVFCLALRNTGAVPCGANSEPPAGLLLPDVVSVHYPLGLRISDENTGGLFHRIGLEFEYSGTQIWWGFLTMICRSTHRKVKIKIKLSW